MADFGFDANLIMEGMRQAQQARQADAELALRRQQLAQQQQVQNANLSNMLWQQQRQRTLSDMVSQQAGGFSEPMARVYAQAGFPEEALNTEETLGRVHRTLAQSQAGTIKTPEQAEKFAGRYAGLYGFTGQEKGPDALSAVQGFAESGMSPEQQATQRWHQAMVDEKNAAIGRSKVVQGKDGAFYRFNPLTNDFEQVSGPTVVPGAGRGGAHRGAGGGATGAALDKQLAPLVSDINPASGRSKGQFGKDWALHAASQRLQALVQPTPEAEPNYNLTVRQVPELVQSVAGMLSSGNQAAQSQLEHLMPHTSGMSLAQKLEYLTGHPEEANIPEFVKQYFETARREDRGALQRIRGTQLRALSAHQGLYGTNPEQALAAARQFVNEEAARGLLGEVSDDNLRAAFQGKGGGGASAKSAAGGGAAGTVTVRRKSDGKQKTFSAETAARYLKDPDYEQVPNG